MPNLKYMYVRNDYKKRDITIVSDLIDENGKYFVKCGWSFRNKKDQFIKREGRNLALDRMNTNDECYSVKFEIEPEKVTFFNIAVKILSHILSKESTPRMYASDILLDMDYYNYSSLYDDAKMNFVKRNREKASIL